NSWLPVIRIPFRRLDEDMQRQPELMKQGLLRRADLTRLGIDKRHPLPLDLKPFQTLARPSQRLIESAQAVKRPLRVTGDGLDEFSGRSPGDLGPAPLAAFLFQQKVSRIGQWRDPPPRFDPGRVPLAERSLQVEPAPL